MRKAARVASGQKGIGGLMTNLAAQPLGRSPTEETEMTQAFESATPSRDRFYVASNIKRFRRSRAEIVGIRRTIIEILSNDNPQTVRQVFYALTVRGVIKKAEVEYQRTVVRL